MDIQSINLEQKLSLIPDQWSPHIVAQMNDYHLKLARIEGEFVWHHHPETDEVFFVIKGGYAHRLSRSISAIGRG